MDPDKVTIVTTNDEYFILDLIIFIDIRILAHTDCISDLIV